VIPRSTSRRAVSTNLEKKGVEATTSAGIAPGTPSDVPVIMTVTGIKTISRIMNGVDRTMLTTKERMLCKNGCSSNWPLPVKKENDA